MQAQMGATAAASTKFSAKFSSWRAVERWTRAVAPAAAMLVFAWGAVRALLPPLPAFKEVHLPFESVYGYLLVGAWLTLAWCGLEFAVESVAKRGKSAVVALANDRYESVPMLQALNGVSLVIFAAGECAIALAFSLETRTAPVMLAKGYGSGAGRLLEQAARAHVPTFEEPELAKSLYEGATGERIANACFQPVAAILAAIYAGRWTPAD